MEINFDISMGKSLVGSSNAINSFLKEVLFGLVEGDSGEWASIESNSGSGSDDDSRQ